MGSWAELKLQELAAKKPQAAAQEPAFVPPEKPLIFEPTYAEKKLRELEIRKAKAMAPMQTDGSAAAEEERNFAINFGKRLGSTVWNQVLPGMMLGTSTIANQALKANEWMADQIVKVPGLDAANDWLNNKTGLENAPRLSDLQKKYWQENDTMYMAERQDADKEFTKGLVQSWDQVHDLTSAINYGVGSLTSLAVQIAGAYYTGGASAITQSVGSTYMSSLQNIAKERGMTLQQVQDAGLDEGAVAVMAGTLSGMIETLGAKVAVGPTKILSNTAFGKEAIKAFMNSKVGQVFRNTMVQKTGRIGIAGEFESATERTQTAVEQAGSVASTDKSIYENYFAVIEKLSSPEAIAERDEAARQGRLGGAGVRAITTTAGIDDKLKLPKDDAGEFTLNVLVPDQGKQQSQFAAKKMAAVEGAPEKVANPTVSAPIEIVARDINGNPTTAKMELVDTGLIDEDTGKTMEIQRTYDPTGGAHYSFRGMALDATTAQEAHAEVLAKSIAEKKVVGHVTGALNIQKAATNPDGTVQYTTGLKDAQHGKDVVITEDPNAEGPKFTAYEGGVHGDSVEDVANQIMDIGTPKVTEQQGKRASKILVNEGVNEESLTHIYKNVFGYSKDQAKNAAARVMGEVNKRTDEKNRAAKMSVTELNKDKKKPVDARPEEAFIDMGIEAYKARAAKAQGLIDLIKKVGQTPATPPPPPGTPPTPAGKLGILPTPTGMPPPGAPPAVPTGTPPPGAPPAVPTGTPPPGAPPAVPTGTPPPSAPPAGTPTGAAQQKSDAAVNARTISVPALADADKRNYAKGKRIPGGVEYDNIHDFLDDMGWNDSAYKEIFDYLKGKDVKFKFIFSDGEYNAKDDTITLGQYFPKEKSITVYNRTPLRTLGHEAIHAALYVSGAWNNPEFVFRMRDIREAVKQAASRPGFRAKHMVGAGKAMTLTKDQIDHYVKYTTKTGSIQEIITHALTHPEYARFLANIPAIRSAKPGESAWSRLKDIVLNYLGEKLNLSGTVLEEMNEVLDKVAGINLKPKDIPVTPQTHDIPTEDELLVNGKEIIVEGLPVIVREDANHFVFTSANTNKVYQKGQETNTSIRYIPKTQALREALYKQLPEFKETIDKILLENATLKKDAVQKPETTGVPVQSTPGNSPAVVQGTPPTGQAAGKGANTQKTQAVEAAKQAVHTAAKELGIDINTAFFKARTKHLTGKEHLDDLDVDGLNKVLKDIEGAIKEVNTLPRSQKSAWKNAIAAGGSFVRVSNFGQKVHAIIAMDDKKGVRIHITHTGAFFFNLEDAVAKSQVEQKPTTKNKKGKVDPGVDTTTEQPAMNPTDGRSTTEEKPDLKVPEPQDPPKPPKPRTPQQQPSQVAPTEIAQAVGAAMRSTFDIMPKRLPKKEFLEFLGNLDENGSPLGAARAFAIMDGLAQAGFIKVNGTKVEFNLPEDTDVDVEGQSEAAPKTREEGSQVMVHKSPEAGTVYSVIINGKERFMSRNTGPMGQSGWDEVTSSDGKTWKVVPHAKPRYMAGETKAEAIKKIKEDDAEVSGTEKATMPNPAVDYRKESDDAAKAARAAAGGTVQNQAYKDMIDHIRKFIADAPEGARSDLNTLTGMVAEAFNVPLGAAKGLVSAAQSASGLFKNVSIGGTIVDFFQAWAHGRRAILNGLAKGMGVKLDALKKARAIDYINPMSYVRAMATTASAAFAVVQAGVKMTVGNLDSEFFAPRAQNFSNWVADVTKKGVTHQNTIIRNINQIMQGFYRGLAYTSTEIRQQSQLRGKRQEGALLAQKWMDSLYTLIGRDAESLAKIHAVLDPEAYEKTQYKGTTYASLSQAEQAVYAALRMNMDNLHNWSFKKGYITQETFDKFINDQGEINYFGRAYQEFYDAMALGEDVGAAANALRAEFSMYKKRKDFDSIQGLNLERDPIYIAAQRMATALQNEAVTDYAESIYNNHKIPRFKNFEEYRKAGSPAGFSALGKHGQGGVYGPLSGMYVPNYIAYDFKGFFLDSALNGVYTAMKAYDRLWIRRAYKQALTVFNPGVYIGNQASNYTFAYVNGVDTFNFNQGIQVAKKAIKERNELYQKLLAEGLLGTGIATEFGKRMPARLEEQAERDRKNKKSIIRPIKNLADKVTEGYSQTDDNAKIAAYYVKTEIYGMSHDQAVTEIMQGFQNYDSVGMYFDISSKMPIFGNAFAKFAGDMMRVAGTAMTHRPLQTASYLGLMYMMKELASDLSGEDELEKEIREGRPFQPKIPFINMPLGWKVGKYEVNVARLIAPLQTYDKGQSESSLWTLADFLPIRTAVMSSGGKPAYMKFDDPLLGPFVSIMTDRDFRNVSISDPKRLMGPWGANILDITQPEYWNKQRMLNRLEYHVRSFGFLPATAYDMYHISMSGEDYFGRKKSHWARVVSNVIRIEEFNTPEARNALTREIDSRLIEIQGIFKDNNQMYFRFKKTAEAISQKSVTPAQMAYQLNRNADGFAIALGDSGPRLRKAIENLYDPLTYLNALNARDNPKEPEEKKEAAPAAPTETWVPKEKP